MLNVKIVGGGPAGLFLAYLLKKSDPTRVVRVAEQNSADATFGFGVVFSGRALQFIAEADPDAAALLQQGTEVWSDQIIDHDGTQVLVDGGTFSAVERIMLLTKLQQLCRRVGVDLAFDRRVEDRLDGSDCDLLVGADGANSAVRDSHAAAFGTFRHELKNFFAWYGVDTTYPSHTLTFRSTKHGVFCGHHYRYTPTRSTFVAECDEATWFAAGFDALDDEARREATGQVFFDTLEGRPLLSNRSLWRRWSLVGNDTWHHENIVLIGDALRTAHPSIGQGTRLAIEDSIALARALDAEGDRVDLALPRYQAERRPIREKLNDAAVKSIEWYEGMAEKMALPPYEFAMDYLLRTGRMSRSRLAAESPAFLRRYEASAERLAG